MGKASKGKQQMRLAIENVAIAIQEHLGERRNRTLQEVIDTFNAFYSEFCESKEARIIGRADDSDWLISEGKRKGWE